jgi:hypothetical protein
MRKPHVMLYKEWRFVMYGHKIQVINLKKLSQMILLHPHKVLIKIIMKKMMNQIIEAKRRATIKGEMSMMGIKEKHHHISSKRSPHRQHIW